MSRAKTSVALPVRFGYLSKKMETLGRMSDFVLDPVLARDTLVLGDLPLCRVLLLNDSRYTWLTLVPRRAGVSELIDLDAADRAQAFAEIMAASEVLRAVARPDKLNTGALGNIVRQLHIHLIARFQSDPAWPGPVWGHSPAVPYPPHLAGVMIDRLKPALAAQGMKESAA